MRNKIAVIGPNGQLDSDLIGEMSSKRIEVSGLTHGDMEVTDIDSVRRILQAIKPSAILNTAAFHNSVLENKCTTDLHLATMPHWKDSLISFLTSQYGSN